MNRSIPDPFQLSRKGSRSVQDPKKVECDPDRELLRSVPDHVWLQVDNPATFYSAPVSVLHTYPYNLLCFVGLRNKQTLNYLPYIIIETALEVRALLL